MEEKTTDANWGEFSSVTETIERLEREIRRCVGFTAYRDQLERELEGEVVVLDPDEFIVGAIKVAPKGGLESTNCAFHGNYLYITEAARKEVWRVKMNVQGAKLN